MKTFFAILLACLSCLTAAAQVSTGQLYVSPPVITYLPYTTGATVWYQMTNGTGTNITDSSGNGNNATNVYSGSPNLYWSNSPLAVNLIANANGYLQPNFGMSVQGQTKVSMQFTFDPTNVLTQSNLLHYEATIGGSRAPRLCSFLSNGLFVTSFAGNGDFGGVTTFVSSNAVASNTWTLFSYSLDLANGYYVVWTNGNPIPCSSNTFSPMSGFTGTVPTVPIYIDGAQTENQGYIPAYGLLGQLFYFPGILTGSEVSQQWNYLTQPSVGY